MTFSDSIATLAGRAHDTIDKTAEQAGPALRRASSAAHETIDKVAIAAEPAAEWAVQSGQKLAVRANETAGACSGFVRARPLASMVGVLAIGYLAGRLSR